MVPRSTPIRPRRRRGMESHERTSSPPLRLRHTSRIQHRHGRSRTRIARTGVPSDSWSYFAGSFDLPLRLAGSLLASSTLSPHLQLPSSSFEQPTSSTASDDTSTHAGAGASSHSPSKITQPPLSHQTRWQFRRTRARNEHRFVVLRRTSGTIEKG